MSEQSRQRYLHVKNRLEELARKYGPLDEAPMPEWLDSLEGWHAWRARQAAQDAAQAAPPPPPAQPAVRPRPAQKGLPATPEHVV